MTPTQRKAMEMALDSLDCFRRLRRDWIDSDEQAYQALRAALAEPVSDEPVAWRYKKEGGDKWIVSQISPEEAEYWSDDITACEPLYTHPTKQEPEEEEPLALSNSGPRERKEVAENMADDLPKVKITVGYDGAREVDLKSLLESPQVRQQLKALSKWTRLVRYGCPVCGIGAKSEVMGYVCNRSDCPTRITC